MSSRADGTDQVPEPEGRPSAGELEELFDVLLETSPNAIGVVSVRENRYVRANAALVDLYALTPEEILTVDPFGLAMRITHPDELVAEQHLFAELVAGIRRSYRIEKRFMRRDGTFRWGLLTFSGVFDAPPDPSAAVGPLAWVIVQVVDISKQKATESTLRSREAELRHAQKIDALGRLAAGVAHDFNNLLTVITGHGEVLKHLIAQPGTETSERDLGNDLEPILDAARRAAALTAQLLAYGRRDLATPRSFVLSQLAATVQQLLLRSLGPDVEIDQGLDATGAIFADQGQIGQVVMNLMLNARDALHDSGRIRLETRDIRIPDDEQGVPGPGDWVALVVSDNGHGMSAEVQARMFEPFFTTRSGRPGMQGTGLGLATVQRIVAEARGQITVESAPGRGTTVSIFFPRTEAPIEAPLPPTRRRRSEPNSRHVLVIEDDPSVRLLLATVLVGAHYWVAVARDGAEAMRTLAAEPKPFDLIVTDLMMPRMGGLSLARQLHESRGEPRILFITGYTHDTPAELEAHGKLLLKPFTPAQLLAAVADALGEDNPLP